MAWKVNFGLKTTKKRKKNSEQRVLHSNKGTQQNKAISQSLLSTVCRECSLINIIIPIK